MPEQMPQPVTDALYEDMAGRPGPENMLTEEMADEVFALCGSFERALHVAREKIKGAPHDDFCSGIFIKDTGEGRCQIDIGKNCNCWKRDALAAIDAELGECKRYRITMEEG